MPEWHTKPHDDLADAIREFKAALPGWWYSVCECQVSCDASCAPTLESEDILRIPPGPQDPMNPDPFDGGFHVAFDQPSTLAEALRDVMRQALDAKAVGSAYPNSERTK